MSQDPHWTAAQRQARLSKLVERNRARHSGAFLYEDAEWMRDAYEVRGLTFMEIAIEAGCGLRTVARWMRTHDIEARRAWPRPTGEHHHRWKGGPKPCPLCGGRMSYGSATCRHCRDRSGSASPKWRGENAEYTAIHYRLLAQRGRPSEHACVECAGKAEEWAYDHSDPEERRNRVGRDDGPYSFDLFRYRPMCKRCHRQLDLGRR
jgi:hypothetical protein